MKQVQFQGRIEDYFGALNALLAEVDIGELDQAMNAMLKAYNEETDIYVFGNGGSASTASHMLNDFNKGVSLGLEKKFRFHCLVDNIAILTAIANDLGYEYVFAKQLENKLKPTDLIIAISGSGNSLNVIRAVEYAKSCGCKVIGMSGYDGGRLRQLADYSMHAPTYDMQLVEDAHLIFNHMVMKVFCQLLSEKTASRIV